ncbi:hypothetical protein AB9P05_08750 [Roseivirga sp. BDSF3-8]|uniref:hypothetical protein n=1 Tax=Roseivirga sp. BDSF3-8 TaxID=3241598 RepID=UPI003531CA8B
MNKHTEEAVVRQTAREYLQSTHEEEFRIIRSKWRCNEGNDCPDVHDVYAVATDEAEVQVVLTLDFRQDPPKVTRDSYHQEQASLRVTRSLEQLIGSPDYLLKAYAQNPAIALPQKPLMVKLYVLDRNKTSKEEVLEALKELIMYASKNKFELLDVEIAFFDGLPDKVTKEDFNLGSFTGEKTAFEKEYRFSTWRFETGGKELQEPDSLLNDPMKNIKTLN